MVAVTAYSSGENCSVTESTDGDMVVRGVAVTVVLAEEHW